MTDQFPEDVPPVYEEEDPNTVPDEPVVPDDVIDPEPPPIEDGDIWVAKLPKVSAIQFVDGESAIRIVSWLSRYYPNSVMVQELDGEVKCILFFAGGTLRQVYHGQYVIMDNSVHSVINEIDFELAYEKKITEVVPTEV